LLGATTNPNSITITRGSGGSSIDLYGIRVASTLGGSYEKPFLDPKDAPQGLESDRLDIPTTDFDVINGGTINIGGIQQDGAVCESVNNPIILSGCTST